jgi:exonuclease SbcC
LLIDRIYLRNYRVFEDELDLVVPPGLVGVYGPNGAGKSTLLESILWTLWGKARTGKEEVPSAGTHGECVAEVTFEHEGHIYLVRRTITGVNATVRAQAHCDGLAMAEGVRDTARYVHSVLGMDDSAFRASVFAEQKQLAAFSSQSPADRRKLVLALLGITPLDAARDRVRADAREAAQQHGRLRSMLPDLQEVATGAADAEAAAAAAEVIALDEERASATAASRALSLKESFAQLDLLRQEHDLLVLEGKAARAELDAANADTANLSAELDALAATEARLAELGPLTARLASVEQRSQLLAAVVSASTDLASLADVPPPPQPDTEALQAASQAAMGARTALGSAEAQRHAAADHLEQARSAVAKSAALSGTAGCPLCGQPLGEAFGQVQAHRSAELKAALAAAEAAEEALANARVSATAALEEMKRVSSEVDTARQARTAWDKASTNRTTALRRLESVLGALFAANEDLALSLGSTPSMDALARARRGTDEELALCRQAHEESSRMRGRLERRSQAEAGLQRAQERASAAGSLVEALRAKVKGLRFDPSDLSAAQAAMDEAASEAHKAASAAHLASVAAATARTRAQAGARRLSEAQSQHARLADLESAAVHLGRTSELLNSFRNSVVASVGPRLAVQAAELFAELTDNEYDRLEVDPETYGLQISDGGISYDLQRFSGSEVDLANLALRVAISEHVRFQSGGTVGLMVLDEVFGPLDDERRARMLIALERLRGRFRQILVVTHSTEIKDQLPHAIEVQKKPGRRATARVVGPDS